MTDTTSLAEQVYAELRDKIVSCAIAPGTWVSESSLAADLGVSKTPAREALRRLAAEGLVQPSHRRGYQVEPITLTGVLRALEAFEILVPEICVLVAERATKEQRAELAKRTREWAAATPGSVPSDAAPYTWLVELCENPVITEMASVVLGRLERIANFALLHGALADSASVNAFAAAFEALIDGSDHDTIRARTRDSTKAARESILTALGSSLSLMSAPIEAPPRQSAA